MKDKTNLTGLNPDNFRSVINGKDTGLYILRNGSGMEMCVTNYGAIVLSIMAPDSHGKFENVVIGFDTLEEARRQSKDYYIGATIGPVAGRILHGAFRVGEKDYHLQLNSVSNTLHSGDNGFHTVVWEAQQPCENQLLLRHFHADGEAGFPGNVTVRMMYTLTDDNGFRIDYEAETDRDTLFCPTNHAYFNLSGEVKPVDDHLLRICSDTMLDTDASFIPTGKLLPVEGTLFDFTCAHAIGDNLHKHHQQLEWNRGYNHCYVLGEPGIMRRAAVLSHLASGRKLSVDTTLPAVLFYSAGFLPGVKGKQGIPMLPSTGVCLETQFYPDAPSHPAFPSTLLRCGETYSYMTNYKFDIL